MDGQVPERVRRYAAEQRARPDGALAVSQRVLASWQRSEDYGVSVDAVEPVFSGTVHDDSLFLQCGHEVLSGLSETLADEPLSLMLTDADGLVLNRFSGDHALLRALDKVHLAPGFDYSEREAGTNGLGLALADRVPTLVHADQHYSASLCGYTCAAVPVLDPRTGRLEGSVNLTTWSRSSTHLLLALAQSAAGNTQALMAARSQGRGGLVGASGRRTPRGPRGQVFRVEAPRPAEGNAMWSLGPAWSQALAQAEQAVRAGRVVAAVGESGTGRSTLLSLAQRRTSPRDRILSATAPDPADVDAWLSLWTPELGKPGTAVVIGDVDTLPQGAARRLRGIIDGARSASSGVSSGASSGAGSGAAGATHAGPVWMVTAERLEDVPTELAELVETVVHVPSLRDRPDDVVPLAACAARRARGRDIPLTPAAERALRAAEWPGNVRQLEQVVREAALQTDLVDLHHLPAEVVAGSGRHLSRIELVERDEIVRAVHRPGASVTSAAEDLGISRATLYRRLAHFRIPTPGAS